MTDVTKLIEELEEASGEERGTYIDALLARAVVALRELSIVIPENGIGESEIPYKIIAELYNTAVQGTHLPPAKGMTPMRRRLIAQRWQEDKERRAIQWWADFWKRVVASDFLSGRAPPSPGHENWRPNFDWFITSRNFIKIVEGSYDNRRPTTNVEKIERFR